MRRVDRGRLPVPAGDPPFRFPRIVRRTMASGLELRAVTHRAVPVASMVLLVPGGSSVDPRDAHGLVSLTASLLDEGSRGQSALEIADRIARVGGDLDSEVSTDAIVIGLATLDRFLGPGLALLREIVTEPNLANDDFNRIRNLRLERLRQLKDHAAAMAERAFARVVYGDHPYGHLTQGSEAPLSAMTVEQIREMHAAMFTPDGATLIVVGDRPEDELLDAAAAAFESWRAPRSTMAIDRAAALSPPPPRPATRFAVVPRAGAAQSELRIGHACAARSTPDYPAILLLNTVLGGDFVSRLNSNLREHKGYTYGVRTGFSLRRGIGPFAMQTSVGTDVTAAALVEAWREIREIATTRPASADEVARAFASVSKGYPRAFETGAQIARSVSQLALHGLPDTYFEEFVPRLAAVTAEEVTRAAQTYLDAEKMTTVIVGDVDKIAEPLRQAGFGAFDVLPAEI